VPASGLTPTFDAGGGVGWATRREELAGTVDPGALDDARWRKVHGEAREAVTVRRPLTYQPASVPSPRAVASVIEAMLDATRPAPSALASVALAIPWLASFAVAAVGVVALFAHAAPAYWKTHALGDSGLTVDMPYLVRESAPKEMARLGVVRLESGSRHRYEVTVWKMHTLDEDGVGDDAPAPSGATTGRVAVSSGSFRGEETLTVSGGRTCKQRVLHNARLLVKLEACAPQVEPEMDRFLTSLRDDARPKGSE
jgi:hypothetical protein